MTLEKRLATFCECFTRDLIIVFWLEFLLNEQVCP